MSELYFDTNKDFVSLEIRIFSKQDYGYPVYIKLGDERDFERGFLSPDLLPWVSSGNLITDGNLLFDSLFSDPKLRYAWDISYGQSERRRIRLWIDEHAPELHLLPWELLRDEDGPLSANANTPFSRYLPANKPWGGLTEDHPIRVLAILSNPQDLEVYNLTPFDVAQDKLLITTSFEGLSTEQVLLEFLEPPVTLKRLEKQLHKGYHILHFLGHGVFSQTKKQAALYFQDETGDAKIVSDDDLITLLKRQRRRPHLVFLAACQSATRSTTDAFAGLGPKLSRAGVPAVVTMQDIVSAKSIQAMTPIFYKHLLEYGEVDCALNAARSVLVTEKQYDAAVPTLFMRLKVGKLWQDEAKDEQIAKVGNILTQFLNTQVFTRLGVEQRLGFLSLAILIIATTFFLYLSIKPKPPLDSIVMSGDFNIAVAEFGKLDSQENVSTSRKGKELSSDVYEALSITVQELETEGFEIEVLEPSLTGFIEGENSTEQANNAKSLANKIKADLLIYGNLMLDNDETSLALEFYLANTKLPNAEELSGLYEMGSPLQVLANIDQNPVASRDLRILLAERSAALAKFSIGLGYFTLDRFDEAMSFFDQAKMTPGWSDNEGKEVLYLFLGNTAAKRGDLPLAQSYFEQALDINSEYARAQLGVAQIHFLQARDGCQPGQVDVAGLDKAEKGYEKALRSQHPPLADIPTKIAFYLARVYFCKSAAGITEQWDDAQTEYERVIAVYEDGNERVKYLAADALAELGLMYILKAEEGNIEAYHYAADKYQQAIDLSRHIDRQAIYYLWLAQIHLNLTECDLANENLALADEKYADFTQLNPNIQSIEFEKFRQQVQYQWEVKCLDNSDSW